MQGHASLASNAARTCWYSASIALSDGTSAPIAPVRAAASSLPHILDSSIAPRLALLDLSECAAVPMLLRVGGCQPRGELGQQCRRRLEIELHDLPEQVRCVAREVTDGLDGFALQGAHGESRRERAL